MGKAFHASIFVFSVLATAESGGGSASAASATNVAAGPSVSCAVTTQGGVSCWGANTQAPPAVGPMRHSGVPVPVLGLPSEAAVSLAPSIGGTCAVTAASDLYCWGNGLLFPSPATQLDTLPTGVSMLSQGGNACAVTTSGSVVCDMTAPAVVPGLESGMAAVSVGNGHQCALTTAGAVLCWGWNDSGQLGNGSTDFYSTVPVAVSGLSSGVTSLAAGSEHTCAVTAAGGAVCWGFDIMGQLGDGPENDGALYSRVPVAVAGLSSGVTAVSAGAMHSCALLASGEVRCWGENERGQLGSGDMDQNHDAPVAVVGLESSATQLSAGKYHTCAVTSGGAVRCWGNNTSGQLGVGSTPHSAVPVDVVALSGIVKLFSATNGPCAVDAGGNAWCWGPEPLGQPWQTLSSVPLPPAVVSSGITAISGYCAVTTVGSLICWEQDFTSPGAPVIVVTRVPSGVSAASGCLLSTTGAVSCWAQPAEYGPPYLVPVPGLESGVAKLSGGPHSCVVKLSGAWCWGENGNGQLGDGTTTDRTLPVAVSGLASGMAEIKVGGAHTCALTTLGGVLCWGKNDQGQLGDGTTIQRTQPVPVSGLASGVVAISLGANHTCAIRADGSVQCWGENFAGQLGDGTFTGRLTPVAVTGLEAGAVSILASSNYTCAAITTGSVHCWGRNDFGQLGDGSILRSGVALPVVGFEATPPAVPALKAPALVVLALSLLAIGGAVLERRAHRR